jgi:hypothetical protein
MILKYSALREVVEDAQEYSLQVEFFERNNKTWVRLLHPYKFHNKKWGMIEEGFESDGASIPDFAYSIAGHPFEYRGLRAALWHDLNCRIKVLPWKLVHQTFNDIMKYDNMVGWRRILRYQTVRWFGPRW